MDANEDAVIAGVHGARIAFHLADRGVRMVISRRPRRRVVHRAFERDPARTRTPVPRLGRARFERRLREGLDARGPAPAPTCSPRMLTQSWPRRSVGSTG
jgi:hypothetical protein